MGKLHDLAGQKFGKLTVIAITNKRAHNGSVIWKCICLHFEDISGEFINDVQIIKMSDRRGKGKSKNAYCWASCPTCHKAWEVCLSDLKRGQSKQCWHCSQVQKNSNTISKTCDQLLSKLEEKIGFKVIREYKIQHRLFDGYIPQLKLLIESDGSYFHSFSKQIKNDQYKNQLAKSVGFNLIRVKNDGLKDHKIAINTITSFIEQLS